MCIKKNAAGTNNQQSTYSFYLPNSTECNFTRTNVIIPKM